MSWFNTLTSNVLNLLRTENPNKVLDVSVEEYSQKVIRQREDSLTLYAPKSVNDRYELVLHRPFNESLHEAYSLCRCPTSQAANLKFHLFRDKIPVYASIAKDACNSAALQRLCDLIMEHPSWTITHLIVHLGHTEWLTDPEVAKFINTGESINGISPLQLAIQEMNVKMVQALINNNASLDHVDNDLNSVMHYAASTNRQIINLLCEKSKSTLNRASMAGYTPLHKACQSDKPECVRALLHAGADVNISVSESKYQSADYRPAELSAKNLSKKLNNEEMKYGGTPLHWACSAEVVEDLISQNCDINIPNFDNRTALHVMVLRNRIECLVALLSHNANCNLGDKDGNTPLHLAVQEGNEAMVKALVVFGADMGYMNNAGHIPRHNISCSGPTADKILYILHSVGSPRCPPCQRGCNPGCQFDLDFNGVPPPEPLSAEPRKVLDNVLEIARVVRSKNERKGKLLCMDGGGIRGLVLVTMLTEIEKKLGKPIIDCFDWVSGTSTGGILILALCCGKTLHECLCLYFRMKNSVFKGSRPYSNEPLEATLKEAFGETLTMSSIKKPKVLIPVVLADRVPVDLMFFRNYYSPSEMLGAEHSRIFEAPPPPEEQLIWHTARATAAAPTYFRPFGRFLDGGLMSNNPTLDALTEIYEYESSMMATGDYKSIKPLSLVLSLGTGRVPLKHENINVDVFRPGSIWQYGKLVQGITTLGQLLVDQATQTDGRVVDRARAWCSSQGTRYYRFSPQLSEEISLDEKDDKILTNMLWETKAYIHSQTAEVSELIHLLTDSDSESN